MQAAFQQAALPEPFKVLGKHLYPYTIGHDILLTLFESCFAIDYSGIPPGDGPLEAVRVWNDLLISIWVCSHESHRDVIDELASPKLGKKLRKWGKKCGKFDADDALTHFKKYLAAHTVEPDYWIENPKSNGGRPSGIPFSQFLKVAMRREFGMSEDDALDTPFCQANFNYLTLLESNGKIRFMSDAEKSAVDSANDPKVEKMLAKMAQQFAKN